MPRYLILGAAGVVTGLQYLAGMNSQIFNLKSKKEQRKKLRTYGTAPEAVLWKYLQKRQLLGKKFRRQESIGPYIVDFYCPECRVIVELDGAAHFQIQAQDHEAARQAYLDSLGMTVLRFENKTLRDNPEGVIDAIKHELLSREGIG